MNYDNSISDQVNLSKVLDEMIVDGTDREVVLAFLKSHERCVPDIFKGSAFEYSLYDLGYLPYSRNQFLLDHIVDLSDVDCCFAASILATAILAFDSHCVNAISELKEKVAPKTREIHEFVYHGWKGNPTDEKVLRGDIALVPYLEKMAKDERDMKSFLSTSHLARTAFMASTFLQLSPTTQYVMIATIRGMVDQYTRGTQSSKVFGHLLSSLLKQLLHLGEVELFNWVVKVAGLEDDYDALRMAVAIDLSSNIPQSITEMMRKSTGNVSRWILRQNDEQFPTFEEIVFEMNLLATEFETSDLFLYIYLFGGILTDGMRENAELLEFFSLPFNWSELDGFKDAHGRPIQRYVDIYKGSAA